MPAMEIVSGFVTAVGAVPTGITPSNGSLSIRSFNIGRAFLVDMWQNQNTAAGYLRVYSPRLHDAVQGIRIQATAAIVEPGLNKGFPQPLVSQDTLTAEMTGSAVGGDISNACLQMYYSNLDAANGKFIGLDELEMRLKNIFTVTFALVGATTGAWGAVQALSAGTGDLSKANTDYAMLGLSGFSETAAGNGAAVGFAGQDTGNLRIGIPLARSFNTANYFLNLTKWLKVPAIPVINSANKGGTFFSVLNNENANTVTASFLLAELG